MALPNLLVVQLAGTKAKLDRAEELLDTFDHEWLRWQEREEPWGCDCEVGDGYKRAIFVFKVLKPIPQRFGVMVGEIVHDMRSALDHLAAYLVQLYGSEPTLTTAWPVTRSPYEWRSKVERRKRPFQLWRKKGAGPLKGIPRSSDAWTIIENSQPYVRTNPARDDPLWELHELWNADKHRILNQLPLYLAPGIDLVERFTFPPGVTPVASKPLLGPERPLKDSTKLALFEFATPYPSMDVQIKLSLQVALREEKRSHDRGDIRDTLKLIRAMHTQVQAIPYPPPH